MFQRIRLLYGSKSESVAHTVSHVVEEMVDCFKPFQMSVKVISYLTWCSKLG